MCSEQVLQDIDRKLSKINLLDEVVKDVTEIKNMMNGITERVNAMELTTESLSSKIERLEELRDEDANRSRRKNLIFYNIPEKSSESYQESKRVLTEFLGKELGVTLKSEFSIERAHRLGRKIEGRSRPLISLFAFWEEKEAILSKRRSLKDQGYDVSNDLTQWARSARRAFYPLFIQAKKEEKRARMGLYELVIEGVTFMYDRYTNKVVQKSGGRESHVSRKDKTVLKKFTHPNNKITRNESRSHSRKRGRLNNNGNGHGQIEITKFLKGDIDEASAVNSTKESNSTCDNMSEINQYDGAVE